LLSSLQSFNQLDRDVAKSSGKQTEIALEAESPKLRITGGNLFLRCDCSACCDATQCHDVSETIHIQHIDTGLKPQQNSRKPTYIELHFPLCSTILHHFPSFSQDFWVNYNINSNTIWLFNIAMENPQNKWRFLAGKIIYKWAIYTMAMLNNQMVLLISNKAHIHDDSPSL
jgi:hypothetical protein